jgi:hypothetical protein
MLLTEHSALTVTKVDQNVQALSAKMEMYFEKVNTLIALRTPLEERVESKIEAAGGKEVALKVCLCLLCPIPPSITGSKLIVLKDNRFLRDVAENDFGTALTPQLRMSLKMDIEESLKANM